MATSVTIQFTITLPGVTFMPTATANLAVTQGITTNYPIPLFTFNPGFTVATAIVPIVLAPGSATIQLNGFSVSEFNGVILAGDSVGTADFTFNDVPNTIVTGVDVSRIGATTVVRTNDFDINVACLHGSSLVQTRNGLKRLDEIKPDEEVLSGSNLDEYVKANLVHCPLAFQGVDHDAIIFEAGSLGENEPEKRLIIDPGHPMCTKKEYLEKGYEALRPAGEIYEELMNDESKSHLVSTKKWTDTFVQDEPSLRYDLLLPEGYNTYIANGLVVRSKGYKDHRYKNFV